MKLFFKILLFVWSIPICRAQIPFDFQGVDENIFTYKDLSSNKIQKIYCTLLSMDVGSTEAMDTLEQTIYYFNADYTQFKTISSYEFVDSCSYFYINGKKKKVCWNCSKDICRKYIYLYDGRNPLSYREMKDLKLEIKMAKDTLIRYDTLIYDTSNKIEKEIDYYFNPDRPTVYDSIVKTYNYNEKGNLIKYSISPSPTFKKNLPTRLHNISSDEIKHYYTYSGDEVIIENYNYYKEKKDSILLSKNIIKKYNFGDRLYVEESNYNNSIDYSMIYKGDKMVWEYALNEYRITVYYEETKLPRSITIHNGDNLLFYKFQYYPH